MYKFCDASESYFLIFNLKIHFENCLQRFNLVMNAYRERGAKWGLSADGEATSNRDTDKHHHRVLQLRQVELPDSHNNLQIINLFRTILKLLK